MGITWPNRITVKKDYFCLNLILLRGRVIKWLNLFTQINFSEKMEIFVFQTVRSWFCPAKASISKIRGPRTIRSKGFSCQSHKLIQCRKTLQFRCIARSEPICQGERDFYFVEISRIDGCNIKRIGNMEFDFFLLVLATLINLMLRKYFSVLVHNMHCISKNSMSFVRSLIWKTIRLRHLQTF